MPHHRATTRPLRLCFLTTFYPPWNFGGDGVQVQRLARALAARGHHITIVHSREGYMAMGGDRHPPSDHDGPINLVAIDAGRGRLSPLATYLTGRPLLVGGELDRALADGFDVLHFHNPSLLGGPGALAHGTGLKLYTAHEHWLLCPTHVLWQRSGACASSRTASGAPSATDARRSRGGAAASSSAASRTWTGSSR